MNYKNIDTFTAFLTENVKASSYDLQAYLADFESSVGETGSNDYELSSTETKSGRPECIRFSREDVFFLDGEIVSAEDNNFDFVEATIIF